VVNAKVNIMKEKIIKSIKDQERYLLNTRERAQYLRENLHTSKTYQYERAKFIGMLEIAKMAKVDTTEFNWIFNA